MLSAFKNNFSAPVPSCLAEFTSPWKLAVVSPATVIQLHAAPATLILFSIALENKYLDCSRALPFNQFSNKHRDSYAALGMASVISVITRPILVLHCESLEVRCALDLSLPSRVCDASNLCWLRRCNTASSQRKRKQQQRGDCVVVVQV